MLEVHVDAGVLDSVIAGLVEADDVVVTERDDEVRRQIDEVTSHLRAAHTGREPAHIAALRPARELYRAVGVDPTKLRPSSEALLRRVLRGGELPHINSLVDLSNWCSIESLLPIGLHDLQQLRGGVVLRRGADGEGYEAIGKGWYSVGGRLTASDDLGPCGSPTSDSRRSMITLATRRCLMIIYAPAYFDRARLGVHVAAAADRIRRHAGGRVVRADVI